MYPKASCDRLKKKYLPELFIVKTTKKKFLKEFSQKNFPNFSNALCISYSFVIRFIAINIFRFVASPVIPKSHFFVTFDV